MASISTAAPQFLVSKPSDALAFCEERLGFERDFVYADFYASVSRDGAAIHLKCAPKLEEERAHRKSGQHLDACLPVSGRRPSLHTVFSTAEQRIVRFEELMLDAISHVALVVADPARTSSLFKELFDSDVISRTDSDGHDETFVRLGRTWFVLVQASVERPRTGDHIAFSVSKATLLACAAKLAALNHEFMLARGDTALYFFDFDHHVFELDTTDLEAELAREL